MKKLYKKDFDVGRDKVICLMDKLGMKVKQRVAYKVTTLRKHSHSVADNIVEQQSNPQQPNQIWADDLTYCVPGQGWMYLAIVKVILGQKIREYCLFGCLWSI